jgi:uncharacterized protein (DUF697 family)/predicted GTPase
VFWLFGKTGSGKTSIIRYLTGAADAEIGTGFKPQTRCSRHYPFPSIDNPVMRFLDTRGLGESRYDPTEDIEHFNDEAHLMIITVRVTDHSLEPVIEPLRQIRQARPERPVVLALTCLHEAYPQQQHPAADPYTNDELIPASLPEELRRCLELQRQRFGSLVDRIVPIDLTRPEEGFDQSEFGGERLKDTLLDELPAACRQTLLNFDEAMRSLGSLREQHAMPLVIGYSTMAATAAAVPTPWVDIPVVMALQTRLVYKLAAVYGQEIDSGTLVQMAGSVGGRLLTRMLVRESLKFIPFVGSAANAALAFAYTYATGKAWCWYFGEICAGNVPTRQELESIWKEHLDLAAELWKKTRGQESASPRDPTSSSS